MATYRFDSATTEKLTAELSRGGWEYTETVELDPIAHVYASDSSNVAASFAVRLRMSDDLLRGWQAERGSRWDVVGLGVTVNVHRVEVALFQTGIAFLSAFASLVRPVPAADWLEVFRRSRYAPSHRQHLTVHSDHQEGPLVALWFDSLIGEHFADQLSPEPAYGHPLYASLGTWLEGCEDPRSLVVRFRNHLAADVVDPELNSSSPSQQELFYRAPRQWYFFSRQSSGYVANDQLQRSFSLTTMPRDLAGELHALLLLALHERVRLAELSRSLYEAWNLLGDDERAEYVQTARIDMLRLATQGSPTDLSRRHWPNQYYTSQRSALGVSEVASGVRSKLSEMALVIGGIRDQQLLEAAREEASARHESERRQDERDRRLERTIGLGALSLGVPALSLAALSVNIDGITIDSGGASLSLVLCVVFGSLVVGLGLSALFLRVLRRKGGSAL